MNKEDSSQKITAENSMFLQKEESKLITLKELRKEVKDVIKGQDKAVDDVTRGIIINQLSNNPRHRSHMLIMGPSGTGKTEMINKFLKKWVFHILKQMQQHIQKMVMKVSAFILCFQD